MIAGYRQHWRRQLMDEGASGSELAAPRALGDIATEQAQTRTLLFGQLQQRLDHPRVFGAEVQLRQMQNSTHGWSGGGAARGISSGNDRAARPHSRGVRIRQTSPSMTTLTRRRRQPRRTG